MRALAKSIQPLRRAALWYKIKHGVHGQSDESNILRRLSDELNAPKTFVEFGFHPHEYNCASLASDHQGLLIDGSARQVGDARALLPSSIRSECQFLTLDNLGIIERAFDRIGVLSIDIDSNDYWLAKALMHLRPTIVSIEYNASFMCEPITVPYSTDFIRHKAHPSGWYHGASLTALTKMAAEFGYGLEAVAEGGANAFFTERGNLDPVKAWRPSKLRDKWSNTKHDEQWDTIKHLPFVRV
jgi:hypothetical protein